MNIVKLLQARETKSIEDSVKKIEQLRQQQQEEARQKLEDRLMDMRIEALRRGPLGNRWTAELEQRLRQNMRR